MTSNSILINGHYLPQPVTGVQRYANEVVSYFDQKGVGYQWLKPPKGLHTASLRQLWMQTVMPFKIPDEVVFWSPTNIGPVVCKRHVLTLHDIAEQHHPSWYDKKYVAWRSFILPGLLNRVQKIMTTSNYARQNILDHYKQARGKVEVVYNGVNPELFHPRKDEEKETAKHKYGLEKPFILSVSTLSDRKNTQGLIKAWKLLPDTIHRDMDLVIVGEPSENIEYQANESSLESVRLIGYVTGTNLAALYSAAKLFVFPSFYESFGLPVIEAMACGTPVITSDNTALKEIAGPSVTTDPHLTEEISEAILSLLNSPSRLEEMGAEGIRWATRFTWEKTASKVLRVLDQVAP